jgi:hypothetical protein
MSSRSTPDHELLDILVDLATLRRQTEAGTAPVVLVNIAVNQSATDQQLDRSRDLESVGRSQRRELFCR